MEAVIRQKIDLKAGSIQIISLQSDVSLVPRPSTPNMVVIEGLGTWLVRCHMCLIVLVPQTGQVNYMLYIAYMCLSL